MKALDVLDERLIRRHNEHPYCGRHPDPGHRSTMRRPTETERLFTSRQENCMTHITRLVTVHDRGTRLTADALCGWTGIHVQWVDPAEETFVCRRCHGRAERYGVPTFGLVPDSGCAITGGRRGFRFPPVVLP